MAVLVKCEGCHQDVDKNGVEPVYEQRLQGKVVYYCSVCNPFFYQYRDDINALWVRVDTEKAKEKEEIRKRWFVKAPATAAKVSVTKKEVKKANAQVAALNDLAVPEDIITRGSSVETEGEVER